MKMVLIVEDELAHSQVLKDSLRDLCEVSVAGDGEEGLFLAKKQHPDLIISDIKMPKMDGVDMIKKLRNDEWGKSAKIMLISNFDLDKEIIDLLAKDNLLFFALKSNTSLKDFVNKVSEHLK